MIILTSETAAFSSSKLTVLYMLNCVLPTDVAVWISDS